MHASSGPFVAIRGSEAIDGVDAFVVDPGGFGAAGEDHFVGS
jgi:predicted Rossmann-fold nucleotide-binding protein